MVFIGTPLTGTFRINATPMFLHISNAYESLGDCVMHFKRQAAAMIVPLLSHGKENILKVVAIETRKL